MAHVAMMGSRIAASPMVVCSQEPMSQKVMDDRVESGSAKYLITARRALINPPIIIPDSSRMVGDLFWNTFDRVSVSMTVTTPAMNASRLIMAAESPSRMAAAAPTQAPLVTPRKSGDTSLFWKVS